MAEFHYRDDIYFRLTDSGDVEVFKRPKRVAYWTQDKGFHDPEDPIFTVDARSWDSITSFIVTNRALLARAAQGGSDGE